MERITSRLATAFVAGVFAGAFGVGVTVKASSSLGLPGPLDSAHLGEAAAPAIAPPARPEPAPETERLPLGARVVWQGQV